MRGVGRSSGAVTIVNALPTGIGCALGIERSVLVEVELDAARVSNAASLSGPRNTLLDVTMGRALAHFRETDYVALVRKVESDIPAGKGLKSSSAVGVALVRAVSDALRRPIADEVAARLAAESALSSGTSATGAFDDALACAGGGVVLTDNAQNLLLARDAWSPGDVAAVWCPPGSHRPSPEYRASFRGAAEEGSRAVDAAKAGEYPEAVRLNTRLVERLLGYDLSACRDALEECGARSAGVSGLGPALVAIGPRRFSGALLEFFPGTGEKWVAELRAPQRSPRARGKR